MSCDNVQKLISLLLDRRVPAGEQGNVLAHLESCSQCGAQFESMQKVRAALRAMNQAPMPADLTAKLRVVASHERERRLSRSTFTGHLRYWTDRARLWSDHLMRPFALPFGGGLVSALVLFSVLVPSLTIQHLEADAGLFTDPYGQVVVVESSGVYTPETGANVPKIEPTYALYPDDANVVWLMIGENGKVLDYSVTKGRLTPDMQSIIMISKFSPATFLGLPTSGLVQLVQRAPRRTLHT